MDSISEFEKLKTKTNLSLTISIASAVAFFGLFLFFLTDTYILREEIHTLKNELRVVKSEKLLELDIEAYGRFSELPYYTGITVCD